MNEKMITIETTTGNAELILQLMRQGFNPGVFAKETEQIRSQLTLSDRELFLKVMRGEYLMKEGDSDYCTVNKFSGKINDDNSWGRPTEYNMTEEEMRNYDVYLAPTKELAETLSQVILGTFRPTQQDIDEEVPFFRYDRTEKQQDDAKEMDGECMKYMSNYSPSWSYFFTATQRDTFARQQEEKREPEPEFFWHDGKYLCFGIKGEFTQTPIGYISATRKELNRIRTELNRLSQLHPKEQQ